MCGRFHIAPEAQLEEIFSPMQLRSFEDQSVKFSGEIFPTDVVPVYIMENGCRLVKPLIWGFPKGDWKGVIFNARQERALEQTMLRDSLLQRRVAVPTSGLFEWTLAPGETKTDR